LIGKALFLLKLEETTKVRAFVDIFGESTIEHILVDVAREFDKRMEEIMTRLREFLVGGDQPTWFYMKEDEFIINMLMDGVDIALRALEAHEVDLSPKQKNNWKDEEEDDYFPQIKHQIQRVDMEATSEGSNV